MKNILLILPYGGVGGMERLALNFYNFYKNKGYNVKALKFFGLDSDIISFNRDEIVLSKKDLFEFSTLERVKFYLLTPFKIRKIIKEYDITHSISFGDLTNVFSALSFTNEKKSGSIHALKSVELSGNSMFSKITKLSYKTTYKNFDKMVCISHAIKQDLIETCGYKFKKNLKVIYNPHDIEQIIKLSKKPIQDKKEKQIFEKDVILFLGRMSIQKSPWHLINAFELLKQKSDKNLVFIGDGDEEVTNYIKILIDTYQIKNHVFFLGRKPNPYKYLAKAKVLALSSHYEGTPNVIVEAIALNTPVVSSNCTKGVLELMSLNKHNESNENIILESGIVSPNLYKGRLGVPIHEEKLEEEKKLSEAISYILLSDEFKISLSKHRKQLLKKFDLEIVSNKYLK